MIGNTVNYQSNSLVNLIMIIIIIIIQICNIYVYTYTYTGKTVGMDLNLVMALTWGLGGRMNHQ